MLELGSKLKHLFKRKTSADTIYGMERAAEKAADQMIADKSVEEAREEVAGDGLKALLYEFGASLEDIATLEQQGILGEVGSEIVMATMQITPALHEDELIRAWKEAQNDGGFEERMSSLKQNASKEYAKIIAELRKILLTQNVVIPLLKTEDGLRKSLDGRIMLYDKEQLPLYKEQWLPVIELLNYMGNIRNIVMGGAGRVMSSEDEIIRASCYGNYRGLASLWTYRESNGVREMMIEMYDSYKLHDKEQKYAALYDFFRHIILEIPYMLNTNEFTDRYKEKDIPTYSLYVYGDKKNSAMLTDNPQRDIIEEEFNECVSTISNAMGSKYKHISLSAFLDSLPPLDREYHFISDMAEKIVKLGAVNYRIVAEPVSFKLVDKNVTPLKTRQLLKTADKSFPKDKIKRCAMGLPVESLGIHFTQ